MFENECIIEIYVKCFLKLRGITEICVKYFIKLRGKFFLKLSIVIETYVKLIPKNMVFFSEIVKRFNFFFK